MVRIGTRAKSIAPSQPDEGVPIVCRLRQPDIDPSVETQVLVDLISQPRIEGADPVYARLGADAAEEFGGNGKRPEKRMPDGQGIAEFLDVPASGFGPIELDCGLQAQVPAWNIERIRDRQPAFDLVDPNVPGYDWHLHEWKQGDGKKAAVIANQVQLQPGSDPIESGGPLGGPGLRVFVALPAIRRVDQL